MNNLFTPPIFSASFQKNVNLLSCWKLNFQKHPKENLLHSRCLINSCWMSEWFNECKIMMIIYQLITILLFLHATVTSYSFTILIFSLWLYSHRWQIFQRTGPTKRKNANPFKLAAHIPQVFATLVVVIQTDLCFEKQLVFKALRWLVWCDKLQSHVRTRWSVLWL